MKEFVVFGKIFNFTNKRYLRDVTRFSCQAEIKSERKVPREKGQTYNIYPT
jgi:hypothetical protein